MKGSRTGSIVLGLAWLAMIVIVYPTLKPVIESFVSDALTVTGITSGFSFFVIDTMPYWGLLMGIAGALFIIVYGGRSSDDG